MDIIEDFFTKKLITNHNTKRTYQRGIELFFQTIKKNPESYFNNGHDYEKDISKYYLTIESMPPMTKKNRINAIRQFFGTMDRTTKDLEIWDTISYRLRGADKISEETPLDVNDLRKILQYGDIGAKAMFLIMSTSGCRIGEIVQILPQDIHTNETPARIVFRAEVTKNNRMRTSFLSSEATESYLAWMKIRDDYLATAVKRTTFKWGKNPDDKRIFPMSDVNARLIWEKMVSKAGDKYSERDTRTGRLKCHPHSLRKFFRSYLGNADLSEHLMGHRGYLSTYRQYNDKQLAKEYLKYVPNLMVFETSPDLTDINKELLEKDKQMTEMQKTIEEMKAQILELRLEKLEKVNGIKK